MEEDSSISEMMFVLYISMLYEEGSGSVRPLHTTKELKSLSRKKNMCQCVVNGNDDVHVHLNIKE